MFAKGKAEGREVRGVSDHHFIRSIYFRDPNGYVIELAAKVPGQESAHGPGEERRARQARPMAGGQAQAGKSGLNIPPSRPESAQRGVERPSLREGCRLQG